MSSPGAPRPYLFDARSAAWTRTTGWERYAREIARRLSSTDPRVCVRQAGSSALPSRLWQDAVAIPTAGLRARVMHFPTMPPVRWAGLGQCQVIYTLHDLTWWRYPDTASRMGRFYYAPNARRALGRCHVVADTYAVAAELQNDFGLSSDSVTVVPLGVSMPEPDAPLVRPKPYLLTVATLEPRKNLARLAEAYARSGISASHDLLVVGRVGWGDPPAGVEIVSGLDDIGLASAYAGATALVLPSIYEGFGLPVVEAMQLGVPVVCSDIPVLREVSGGHATLVDPTDLESLIEGLRASLTLSAPAGAADWARKTWRWERTVSALSALYRKLDRGRRQ